MEKTENKKSPGKGTPVKLLQNASQNEPFTKNKAINNEDQSPSSSKDLEMRIPQRAISTGQGQRFNRTRKQNSNGQTVYGSFVNPLNASNSNPGVGSKTIVNHIQTIVRNRNPNSVVNRNDDPERAFKNK